MIDRSIYAPVVERALVEDLAQIGDITTSSVVSESDRSKAQFAARHAGVIAGMEVARYVFEWVDSEVEFTAQVTDGTRVDSGEVLAVVEGSSRSILIAERTALNFLGRMSGVATETERLVAAVDGTKAKISDTRKTMPGLRHFDKHAVTAGGGVNHRMGLYDAVLIKDNHIVAAGDIIRAVEMARTAVGPDVMVEVEVDDLDQLLQVLKTDADRVLLDNMSLEMLAEAVDMVDGRMTTEASGGVTLDTVRGIAETGVDIISVGWITHSPPQLDIGLDFVS